MTHADILFNLILLISIFKVNFVNSFFITLDTKDLTSQINKAAIKKHKFTGLENKHYFNWPLLQFQF